MSIDIVPAFDSLPVDVTLKSLQNEIDAAVAFEGFYRETVQKDLAVFASAIQLGQSEVAHAQSKLAGFKDDHSFGKFHLFERFSSSRDKAPQDSTLKGQLEAAVEAARSNLDKAWSNHSKFLAEMATPESQGRYIEKTLNFMDVHTPAEAAAYRTRIQEARDYMHDDRLGITPAASPEIDRVRYSMAQGKAMVFANEASGRVGGSVKLGQHNFVRIYSGSSQEPDMLLPSTPELLALRGSVVTCEVTKRDGTPLGESKKDVDQNEPFFDSQSTGFDRDETTPRQREQRKREREIEDQNRSYGFLAYGANPEMLQAIDNNDITYKFDEKTKRRLLEKNRRRELSERELAV